MDRSHVNPFLGWQLGVAACKRLHSRLERPDHLGGRPDHHHIVVVGVDRLDLQDHLDKVVDLVEDPRKVGIH